MKNVNNYQRDENQGMHPVKAIAMICALVGLMLLMGMAWPSNANSYNLNTHYAHCAR